MSSDDMTPIRVGFAYLWADQQSQTEHLWFVISSPQRDSDQLVVVNVSTHAVLKDQSCVLDVGDHPFITHKSCVMYDEAEFRSLQELSICLDRHIIFEQDRASDALIEKLWDGASVSRRLPIKFKRVLSDQGLI